MDSRFLPRFANVFKLRRKNQPRVEIPLRGTRDSRGEEFSETSSQVRLRWNQRATHIDNFLLQNCNIFSASSIFKVKQIMNLLLLNHFYPAISSPTSLKEKESCELLCTVRSLVTVRNQLPSASGQLLENIFAPKLQYFLSFKYI